MAFYCCFLLQPAMFYVIWTSPASQTSIHCTLPLTHCVSTRGPVSEHAKLYLLRAVGLALMPQVFTFGWVFLVRLSLGNQTSPPQMSSMTTPSESQPENFLPIALLSLSS